MIYILSSAAFTIIGIFIGWFLSLLNTAKLVKTTIKKLAERQKHMSEAIQIDNEKYWITKEE